MRRDLYGCLLAAAIIAGGCRGGSSLPPRKIIDSHVHISTDDRSMERALRIFERSGIERFCTKSAGFFPSERFRATVELQKRLGSRFAFFANLDWRGIDDPRWAERECKRLEKAKEAGARGVKIFKNLGLGVRTADGKLLPIDDARMDPIMETCADLGLIVAIHTGDPKVFFQDPGPENERYMELLFAPGWSFFGGDYPPRDELLQARNRLIARHPRTTFLGIHLANNPEDLDAVDRWLDQYPNLYVDVSARLGEIGRHPPEKVRAFFVKHRERILFGSDLVVNPDELQLGSLSIFPQDEDDAVRFYRAHREYFETDRKQIDHPTPIQGYWKVDAVGLPEEVLEKFYRGNALRLIWGEPEEK